MASRSSAISLSCPWSVMHLFRDRLRWHLYRLAQARPHRREAPAMMWGRAEPLQCRQVRRRLVADIGFPAVARKGLGQPAHVAVAGDLGEDRGGGDRIGPRVAADNGLGPAA